MDSNIYVSFLFAAQSFCMYESHGDAHVLFSLIV